jgi:hypothetical protein
VRGRNNLYKPYNVSVNIKRTTLNLKNYFKKATDKTVTNSKSRIIIIAFAFFLF